MAVEKKKRVIKKPEQMTPEELEAWKQRNAPKNAYLLYTVNEDQSLNIDLVTRSADEALVRKDENSSLKLQRILVK